MDESNILRLKELIYARVGQLEMKQLCNAGGSTAVYILSYSKDIPDELTLEQQRRLQDAIRQADENKTFTHEEVKRLSGTWISR